MIAFALCVLCIFLRLSTDENESICRRIDEDPLGILQQPLFLDESHLLRLVVIVNWNTTFYRLCFLMLCGDVQPNPGPVDVYPCSVCGEPVRDDDKAVFCESCNLCAHVTCDPSLSDELYNHMVQNPSSDPWYCSMCSTGRHHCDSHTRGGNKYFSCVCLNARSVLPKRFDLFAYICCHQIDILAVTKTFLDPSITDAEVCPSNYVVFRQVTLRNAEVICPVLAPILINTYRCEAFLFTGPSFLMRQ